VVTGQLQDRAAIATLIEASRDANRHVRADAAWALGLVDTSAGDETVVGLARDSDESVRLAAVCSAGSLLARRPAPVQALLDVIEVGGRDSDLRVRNAAAWGRSLSR